MNNRYVYLYVRDEDNSTGKRGQPNGIWKRKYPPEYSLAGGERDKPERYKPDLTLLQIAQQARIGESVSIANARYDDNRFNSAA